MARFLGNATGRTTTTYVDNAVNTACSNLCTYTNTTINTACTNLCDWTKCCICCACASLCSYVNTCKVACNGSGAGLTNVVNSIAVSGTGISVNQSTGAVTITSSGGADPKVLFKCAGCWNGSATIASGDRGNYHAYEIIGHTMSHQYYCSQATFAFAGACGGACSANFPCYCCAHVSCGLIGCRNNQFYGDQYSCGGAIAWPFGCSSNGFTACNYCGFSFHALLTPNNPCNGSDRLFRYCFSTNNGYYAMCTGGVWNTGTGYSCCGGNPGCLIGVCFTTPSASGPFGGCTSMIIIGHGKI